ncbi:MAG: DUF4190 domain-containing protein [Isosphaeraceae bacterium]
MAIDPQTGPELERASAIENEIPAYRAISPLAVVSLILGLGTALSFADLSFLVAGVLAVVTGLVADRTIRRKPDVLTGRGLARAGIGLALVFGLAAVTTTTVRNFLLHRQADAFARMYTETLKNQDMVKAVYYKSPHSLRIGKSPAEVYKALKDEAKDPMIHESEFSDLEQIINRIKSKDTHLEFIEIESIAFEGLTPLAAAVLEIHGPAEGGHPAEEFALLELRGEASGRTNQWFISGIHYPYKLKSYVAPVKPVDDGHGHNH